MRACGANPNNEFTLHFLTYGLDPEEVHVEMPIICLSALLAILTWLLYRLVVSLEPKS